MPAITPLQRPLAPPVCRHAVHVAVLDFTVQGGDDLIFPCQEVRARQIDAGDRVVRDERAVAGQVFHEEWFPVFPGFFPALLFVRFFYIFFFIDVLPVLTTTKNGYIML